MKAFSVSHRLKVKNTDNLYISTDIRSPISSSEVRRDEKKNNIVHASLLSDTCINYSYVPGSFFFYKISIN